jgi:hypothetical protein
MLRERTRPGLGIIEPCLPSPAKAPPSGLGWIHEIKHDGFRILARRDSAGVRLITPRRKRFLLSLPLYRNGGRQAPGSMTKFPDSPVTKFFAITDRIMKSRGCSKVEAMQLARKRNPRLFGRFQNVR